MKQFFTLLIISIFALFGTSAADDEIDSLKKLLSKKIADTLLAETNIQLAVQYWDINPDSAILFSREALRVAERSQDKTKIASALKTLGVSYDYQGNMDSCLKYLHAGLYAYQRLNKLDKVSHVYNDLAAAWLTRGNYELSLRNHFKALALRKQFGNERYVSMSYNNIGLIYRSKKEYNKAIWFYKLSLELKEKLNDQQGLLNTYINLGSVYYSKGTFDSASYFASKALKLAEHLNKRNDVLAARGNLAVALTGLKKYNEALQLLAGTEEEVAAGADPKILVTLCETYGTLYKEIGKPDLALHYLLKGLAFSEKIDRMESKELFSRKLSELYAFQGNYSKSYDYAKLSRAWNDSLFNEENIRQANELSAVFESNEKEKQIDQLSLEKEVTESKMKWLIVIAILLLTILIITWKAFSINRNKNNLLQVQNETIHKTLKEKEFLMKEIHHRVKNNMQLVSSLLSLQSNYIHDDHALEAVTDSRNRVQSMSLIHQSLYTEHNMASLDVKEYIQKLTENLFHSYNLHTDNIRLETEIEDVRLDVDTIVPVGLIVNELITNSIKYAFPNHQRGCIRVIFKQFESNQIQLSVYDNGIGMQSADKKDHSFGYKMIEAFLAKLEGTMHQFHEDGTKVDIYFPYQNKIH